MAQGVQEQRGRLPAIEAKRHFVQVGREMFCADLVPASHDAAFEERERRFNGVCVNVANGINARLVFDRLVLCGESSFLHRTRIRGKFVGDHYLNILADVLSDVLRQRAGLRIRGMEEAQIAAALPNADYDFFRGAASRLATAWRSAADIGFIHFDSAVHHGPIYFLHGGTNTVTEIPCSLVADANGSLDLVSRDPLRASQSSSVTMNHLFKGRWESWKMLPTVTLN